MTHASLWTLLGFHLLATASPGPDFAVVLRNSLRFSRRAGLMTAVGILVSNTIHLALAFVGIAGLLHLFPQASLWVQRAGALYLVFIGWRMLRSQVPPNVDSQPAIERKRHFFRLGFFTSMLNGKALVYFASMAAILLGRGINLPERLIYGSAMVSISFCWFAGLAICFGSRRFYKFSAAQLLWLDRGIGVILVLLGIRLLLF